MRVVQLIDSLAAGGAERMAVTLANSLSKNHPSFLVATRSEGPLVNAINTKVNHTCLHRKKRIDLKALLAFKNYLKNHKIQIIHAHSTSFFFAILTKFLIPSIKIVYHEHNGAKVHQGKNEVKILRYCSRYFSSVITVNAALEAWVTKTLHVENVVYIPNFITFSMIAPKQKERKDEIIHLANLRSPKNHTLLIKAFAKVAVDFPSWQLRLVGAGYNDAYERSLRLEISKENIKDRVLFHGISNCVDELLAESKIGVLSSTSEGLPMALLEYGKARLAVVSTNVGYCGEVISTFGQVVGVDDVSKLSEALRVYMDNNIRREFDAIAFQNHIYSCYSENTVIPLIEKIYKNALRIL